MTEPTKSKIEAAMEFCPDALDHQWHTDKYACVKIAQFLADREAEVLRPLNEVLSYARHQHVGQFVKMDENRDSVFTKACRHCGLLVDHIIHSTAPR